MVTASAPAKAILFGEHAVVYTRPAIAVPLPQVRAEAAVAPGDPADGIVIDAPDLGRRYRAREAAEDALALTVRNTLASLGQDPDQPLRVTVRSAVPLARGLGSGAAIATAIVRALAAYFNRRLAPAEVSDLVYQTEVVFHGTPSGIDNTVVAYEQPIYFVRGRPPAPLVVGGPLHFVIADTGVTSPTRVAVGDVRRGWLDAPARFEAYFDAIAALVEQARDAIAAGDAAGVGRLMDENHRVLIDLDVSSPDLERLVAAARAAGALGAKLSGGGRGGVALALVTPDRVAPVENAVKSAGAARTLTATLH